MPQKDRALHAFLRSREADRGARKDRYLGGQCVVTHNFYFVSYLFRGSLHPHFFSLAITGVGFT